MLRIGGMGGCMKAARQPHLDAVQEDGVRHAHAILQLAANADGHVGPDFAVLADLGAGVHNHVALVLGAARQLVRRRPPQGRQVQLQACAPSAKPGSACMPDQRNPQL